MQAKSQADPSKIVKLKIAIDADEGAAAAGHAVSRPGRDRAARGVVQIPADAVFVTPDGPVAYRDSGGELERVKLTLGRRNATAIEVKAGLARGRPGVARSIRIGASACAGW